MKKFLIIALFLSLMGCGDSGSSFSVQQTSAEEVIDDSDSGDPDDDSDDPEEPDSSQNPDFPTDTSIFTTIDRAVRDFIVSWTALPSQFTATLCEPDSNEDNGCKVIKEATAGNNFLLLELGVDITLAQLLANELFVLYEDSSTTEYDDDLINIDLSNIFINSFIQYIKPTVRNNRGEFGFSLALSEDGKTLAIGSRFEDTVIDSAATTPSSDSGAVYIFSDVEDAGWQLEAFVKHPYGDFGDEFGKHLSISADGTVIAVGIPEDDADLGLTKTISVTIEAQEEGEEDEVVEVLVGDNDLSNSGSIAILRKTDSAWGVESIIKSNVKAQDMFFGTDSLVLSADASTLAVSHYSTLLNCNSSTPDCGTDLERVEIFTYTGDADTPWAYLTTLSSSTNTQNNDIFGFSTAISDDGSVLAISAPFDDSINASNPSINALVDSGSVYIFTRDGDSFTQTAYLKPETPAVNQLFGSHVDLSQSGDILAVGAKISNEVYLLDFQNDAWAQRYIITLSDAEIDDQFGHSLAINNDGSVLAVGIIDNNDAVGINGDIQSLTSFDSGAVYVFDLTDTEYTQAAYLKPIVTSSFDFFGSNVDGQSSKGIAISGDGKILVVGAPEEDSISLGVNNDADNNNLSSSGAAYVFYF